VTKYAEGTRSKSLFGRLLNIQCAGIEVSAWKVFEWSGDKDVCSVVIGEAVSKRFLKNMCACRCNCVGVDNRHRTLTFFWASRRPLAGLWDCPVTWELKNIPPLAAVENIGQWTKVWTSTTRKMRDCINREGYESCKVCPRAKKMTLRLLESRAKKVPAAAVIPWRGSVTGLYWA